MKRRLDYLDSIKGIAILLVVYSHVCSSNYASGEFLLVKLISAVMLPVFFCVTGMLMNVSDGWKNQSIKGIVIRSAKNLLYPYFTFSILSFMAAMICQYCGLDTDSLVSITFFTFTLVGYSALWFLPTLFFSKIIFVVIQRVVNSKKTLILFSLCFMAISSAISLFVSRNDYFDKGILTRCCQIGIYVIGRLFIGLFFMFVGYMFYDFIKSDFFSAHYYKIVGLSLVLLFAYICIPKQNITDIRTSYIGNPPFFYITAVVASLSLIIISKAFLCNCKVLRFFGKNSLIIFATHLSCQIVILTKVFTDKINEIMNLLNPSSPIYIFTQLILIMLIECVLVIVINRFFPWIIKYPDRKNKLA